jgi:hypothetical protein
MSRISSSHCIPHRCPGSVEVLKFTDDPYSEDIHFIRS